MKAPDADVHAIGAAATVACTVSLIPYTYPLLVEQTVPAGRAALGLLGDVSAETRRLRRAGLPTAAALLAALCTSAAQRERDPFGRLLPADIDGFATHWLSAARYTSAVSESLCAAAWEPTQEGPAAPDELPPLPDRAARP